MTKRVAHFVPAYQRRVDIDVAMAIARDAQFCAANNWTHMPFYLDVGGIARARNIAVREAFEHDAELLLMQDSDVYALPPFIWSALAELWKTMHQFNAAVVGAGVPIRNKHEGGGVHMNCEPYEHNRKIAGNVGTGLMLINLRQLRGLLEPPWFVETVSADGERLEVGEDIGFCKRVREAGLTVIVDTTFPTVHTYYAQHASRIDP